MESKQTETEKSTGSVRTGHDVLCYIDAMERMLAKHAAKRARVIGLPR